MGDVDFFKYVNDTYGHQAGDETLRQLAKVISTHMEHLGFVFRWGGEEFVLNRMKIWIGIRLLSI